MTKTSCDRVAAALDVQAFGSVLTDDQSREPELRDPADADLDDLLTRFDALTVERVERALTEVPVRPVPPAASFHFADFRTDLRVACAAGAEDPVYCVRAASAGERAPRASSLRWEEHGTGARKRLTGVSWGGPTAFTLVEVLRSVRWLRPLAFELDGREFRVADRRIAIADIAWFEMIERTDYHGQSSARAPFKARLSPWWLGVRPAGSLDIRALRGEVRLHLPFQGSCELVVRLNAVLAELRAPGPYRE